MLDADGWKERQNTHVVISKFKISTFQHSNTGVILRFQTAFHTKPLQKRRKRGRTWGQRLPQKKTAAAVAAAVCQVHCAACSRKYLITVPGIKYNSTNTPMSFTDGSTTDHVCTINTVVVQQLYEQHSRKLQCIDKRRPQTYTEKQQSRWVPLYEVPVRIWQQ